MGRTRKALKMRQEARGRAWVVYFRHPVQGQTVRVSFGTDSGTAKTKLDWFNRIFMNPENWKQPPGDIPKEIRDLWLGAEQEIKSPDEASAAAVAVKAAGEAAFYKELYETEVLRNKALRKELEHWRGSKLRDGPCPTLREAFKAWEENYKGRDADSTHNMRCDLLRFMKRFDPGEGDDEERHGETVEVDYFIGREGEIDSWIRGLTRWDKRPLSAGRRDQIRGVVLKMLTDAGAAIDRKAIARAGRRAMRADRGAIRWLERSQALLVAEALTSPWDDYFRVQVAMGFRPDELITLKRSDFHGEDFARVSLSPLDHLTLKLGSRTLNVPAELRPILDRRFAKSPILFPGPDGKPWDDAKKYNRAYNAALKKAGAAAGVLFKMDCRVGRRTCASLLLRDGVSVERVAALLGDDPRTIREHYASILPDEVHPSGAVLV